MFGTAVQNSEKSDVPEARIKILNEFFTYSLYDNICRSLFEDHKLLFSFLLTTRILFGDDKMDPEEWNYFLTGPQGGIEIPQNKVKWLGDLEWGEIYKQIHATEHLAHFHGFKHYFLENTNEFVRIYDAMEPEKEPLPGDWDHKLNSF